MVQAQAGRDEEGTGRAGLAGWSDWNTCGEARVVGRLVLLERNPQLTCSIRRLAVQGTRRSVGRVDDGVQRGEAGHDLLVQLDLLGNRVTGPEHAGQVAARTGEALHKTVAHRIGRV